MGVGVRTVVALRHGKVVANDDVQQQQERNGDESDGADPACQRWPTLDAAAPTAREEALVLLVVAVARATKRTIVALLSIARECLLVVRVLLS